MPNISKFPPDSPYFSNSRKDTGPHSKYLQTKKIDVTENFKIVLGRVENIMAKGENTGSPFHTIFSTSFFLRDRQGP